MSDFSDEQWRDIPGFNGLYSVSNLGRVRANERIIYYGSNRSHRIQKPYIKKLNKSTNGYYRVSMTNKDRMSKNYFVHSLVAWSFIREQKPKEEVRHIDGNPLNNNVENLCYGTRSDNMRDAIRHRTFSMSEWHPCARLSTEEIKDILLSPESAKVMAEKYKIHPHTIHKIRRGEVRAHECIKERDMQPVRKRISKRDLLTDYEKQVIFDLTISQRKAAKLLGLSQRAIFNWRKKFVTTS